MRSRGAFGGVAIGLCLALAACEGKPDRQGETAVAKAPPPPALTAAPVRPEGADAVDEALVKLKAWNESAALELKAVGDGEATIHVAAARALEAARGAESGPAERRASLIARVTAARKEVEAARALAVDGQAKLAKDADEQVTAADAMLEACGASVALMAYEGCKGLEAEQALLLGNIEALTAGYQKVDRAYASERAKLEEASAAVALAALR